MPGIRPNKKFRVNVARTISPAAVTAKQGLSSRAERTLRLMPPAPENAQSAARRDWFYRSDTSIRRAISAHTPRYGECTRSEQSQKQTQDKPPPIRAPAANRRKAPAGRRRPARTRRRIRKEAAMPAD